MDNKCKVDDRPQIEKEGDCSTVINDTNNKPCPDNSCVEDIGGRFCVDNELDSPWDLTQSPESCIIDSYIEESLNIGGATLNVHKLLGVKEYGKLQDLTGNGAPITSGDMPNFPSTNAFDKFITEWRSMHLGQDILKYSYIGYDFGEIKLFNDRRQYGIDTFVKEDISTIRIKQSCEVNRVTKIRVERSNDGAKWYGVAVLDVPNCDGIVDLKFNKSVPSRFWRIRPLNFLGGSNDWWSVQALQFTDYQETSLSNIEDKIFMENRNRDYQADSVFMKGSYQPVDTQSLLSKIGFNSPFNEDMYMIEVNFKQAVARLGRPFVIGDIIQLPSETQYTPSLKPVMKFVEVTDVSWATGSYTPNWIPLMQRLIARPPMQSQETQDIFGDLSSHIDSSGLVDNEDGSKDKKYQDAFEISDTIAAEANTMVPMRGEDTSNQQELSDELKQEIQEKYPNLDVNRFNRYRNVFGIDAMPPNGEPYTEADEFPESPKHGDYHRLTYLNIRQGIPPRLYRYSDKKKRWIYLETDRRSAVKDTRQIIQEFID